MDNLATTIPRRIIDTRLNPSTPAHMMQDASASTWNSACPRTAEPFSRKSSTDREVASRPIFAIDPFNFKRNQTSSAVSFAVHAIVIALVLFLALRVHTSVTLRPEANVTPVSFSPYVPPPAMLPVARSAGGGGGGGAHEVVEASKGHLPIVAKMQITPSQILRIDRP